MPRHTPPGRLRPGVTSRRLLTALVFGLPAAASALTVGQAYDAALQYDAQFRAAAYELQAVREGVTIARAALLPSASFVAGQNNVNGTRTFPNGLNQEVRLQQNYEAPQVSLTVRMPLLNFDGLAAEKQAEAQVAVAEEQYRAVGIDLVERLATAYLLLQQAQEVRGMMAATLAASETQLLQARQRETRGEGTRVQVAQALAVLAIARSRAVEAELQVGLSQRQLTRITGVAEPVLPVDPTVIQPPPETAPLGTWIGTAMANSPSLRVRERAVELARATVRRQSAAHLPRVDAFASISRSENESVTNLGQTSQLRSVGVQLNVPLYSGGAVSAAVRQALARQSQAEEELRAERELVILEVQRQWQAFQASTVRLLAIKESLRTADLATLGARRALAAGQGTLAEVAEAQLATQTVRRELITARTDALQARVRLQVRSGVAMADIAAELAGFLTQGFR